MSDVLVKDSLLNEINENWKFDSNVANCFDNMLSRSIPQYDVMRDCVSDLSNIFLTNYLRNKNSDEKNFSCLDIGCSNGLMIEHMKNKIYSGHGIFEGVDVSEPMLEKAKEKFKNDSNVYIHKCDLRTEFPSKKYDIITCILSLMFTPIEHRHHIVQSMYDGLEEGGCLFLVEKVLGNNCQIADMFTENYYNLKREHGYSQEQIDRKRLSLEGVQVCVSSEWNFDLLKQAGFRKVDTFWKWCNFMGIVAIK